MLVPWLGFVTPMLLRSPTGSTPGTRAEREAGQPTTKYYSDTSATLRRQLDKCRSVRVRPGWSRTFWAACSVRSSRLESLSSIRSIGAQAPGDALAIASTEAARPFAIARISGGIGRGEPGLSPLFEDTAGTFGAAQRGSSCAARGHRLSVTVLR
jgi:hypothetical protein